MVTKIGQQLKSLTCPGRVYVCRDDWVPQSPDLVFLIHIHHALLLANGTTKKKWSKSNHAAVESAWKPAATLRIRSLSGSPIHTLPLVNGLPAQHTVTTRLFNSQLCTVPLTFPFVVPSPRCLALSKCRPSLQELHLTNLCLCSQILCDWQEALGSRQGESCKHGER